MRRPMRWLGGLGLLGLLALAAPAFAEGLPDLGGERLSGIRVDVGPLLARGDGLRAQALQADLTRALAAEFADVSGGRGPTLVVRLNSLSMNPYVGNQGRSGFGGSMDSDYLDGEALLIGRRGEVLARHPQLSVVPASSGGAWYDPESERRRVTAIAAHYAGWLRRALPSR
jgi:hypothetical protein